MSENIIILTQREASEKGMYYPTFGVREGETITVIPFVGARKDNSDSKKFAVGVGIHIIDKDNKIVETRFCGKDDPASLLQSWRAMEYLDACKCFQKDSYAKSPDEDISTLKDAFDLGSLENCLHPKGTAAHPWIIKCIPDPYLRVELISRGHTKVPPDLSKILTIVEKNGIRLDDLKQIQRAIEADSSNSGKYTRESLMNVKKAFGQQFTP